MSLLYSLVNVTSVSLLVGLTLFLLNVVLDKTKPKQKDLSFMKHVRLGRHYRAIVILLINSGILTEVKAPPSNQKIVLYSKRSESGKDWSLRIPNDGLELTINDGVMFLHYTNKRTGFKWTRNFTDYITNLRKTYPFKDTVLNKIDDEFILMKTVVNTMVGQHKLNNTLETYRNTIAKV